MGINISIFWMKSLSVPLICISAITLKAKWQNGNRKI